MLSFFIIFYNTFDENEMIQILFYFNLKIYIVLKTTFSLLTKKMFFIWKIDN